MVDYIKCNCGREAGYIATIELRRPNAGAYTPPEDKRRAYLCPRCLERRYATLFGGFTEDKWATR